MKSDAMKSGRPEGARGAGSTEQVKAMQQALTDKGHDAGGIDGKMGPKTQAALRDFQQQEGLKATGRADADTMAKLGGSSSSDTGASKDATSTGAKQTK
jgi:peptidoglycan hydrolase-like protein with peptidoglycan-binding domain